MNTITHQNQCVLYAADDLATITSQSINSRSIHLVILATVEWFLDKVLYVSDDIWNNARVIVNNDFRVIRDAICQ